MKRTVVLIALISLNLITHVSQATMRIMTYNIRREGAEDQKKRLWANRMPKVIALLNHIEPDIIGFQEVIDSQRNDLATHLPDFEFIGQSRGSSWFGLATDEATPIAYRTSRLELQKQGTFHINIKDGSLLSRLPWETGLLPRVCTWAKFKDKENNKEFYLYNTHLDHKFAKARKHQIKQVMKDIKRRTQGLPVFITGDFNARFEGDMQKICVGFTHAKDQAKLVEGPEKTSTGWDSKKEEWIDHILLNNQQAQVLRYQVVEAEGYPSDHRPVFAELIL